VNEGYIVHGNNFVIWIDKRWNPRGTEMISRKMKFLSAAVAVAALIATVAAARTVHMHSVPTDQVLGSKIIGTAPDQAAPPHRHRVIVCGMAIDSDCEKIETLLPM